MWIIVPFNESEFSLLFDGVDDSLIFDWLSRIFQSDCARHQRAAALHSGHLEADLVARGQSHVALDI